MVNYTNSKVYKIWSRKGDKIYVGSTTKQYLSQRMDNHRTGYKSWKDGKCRLITSFQLFDEYGLENCFIELLEAKECKSKDELRQLEGKYIRELECVNIKISGRTKKENYEQNKEQILKQCKEYRDKNKEKISVQKKQRDQDNKEKILRYQKQYRDTNKVKLNETQNCECGGKYTHGHKSRHLRTMIHCQFIESKAT